MNKLPSSKVGVCFAKDGQWTKGMGSHRIQFFATRKDLEQILAVVDAKAPALNYVLTESASNVISLNSLLDFDSANASSSIGNRWFKIFLKDAQASDLQQEEKLTNSSIEQQPHLNFRPAGVLSDGILIISEINVLSQEPSILRIFELFRRVIKRQSTRICSVRVCREAEELLDKGWRLTAQANTIKKSNLRRRSHEELQIDALIAEICFGLKNGSIGSIEISSVLDRGFSFDALSTAEFEDRANAKLIANEPRKQPWFEKLLKALRNLHVQVTDPSIRPPDVCWGINFYSTNKTRTIYLDGLGNRAVIEGRSVGCDKRLLKVMKTIN